MFSTTTMASSITRPTAAASPPSVIRLKLSPTTRRVMNVTATVAGITSPATSEVPQSRRNSTMMMDARIKPDQDGVANALDRIVHDLGLVVERAAFRRPRGSDLRMAAISACTSSATCTVLLSGCRLMFSSTAGLPFAVTMV